MEVLNDSIFDDTSIAAGSQQTPLQALPSWDDFQQELREQEQQQQQDYGGEEQDMAVLFQLIESREWEGVISFCNQVPDSATVGRVYAEDVLNLPLHEVVKQPNPSLTVVNLLLQMYPEGIQKRGYQGNLPLHFACTNENISIRIIQRLLEAYPAAARLRNDEDALPVHLACQYLTSLDSIMCILQVHPEGAYLRDADGFTALDYATGSDKATIEQMAPVLVETAKAAADRKAEETNQKIKGIQEAHAEYIRQLSEREEESQNEMIQAQIDLQDELSSEKERNIVLAERIIDKERKLQDLQIRVDQLTNLIKDERVKRQLEASKQQKEFKEILGVAEEEPSSPAAISLESSRSSSKAPIQTSKNVDVKTHLSALVQKFNLQKTQYAEMAKDLTYNTNMVRNLNELLTTKDEIISDLKQENAKLNQELHVQTERGDSLESTLQETQDELLDAKQEIQRLTKAYQQQSELLTESNRIVRVQESRLASIKSLAQSLSFNIESWALDDQQQEEEWGRQSQSRSRSSQPDSSSPGKQDDLRVSPTDEDDSRFEVLEGMETIQGKASRPNSREDQSLKTNEDNSLKTSETGLSTKQEDSTLPPPSPDQNELNRSTSNRPVSAMRQQSG